MDFSVTLFFYSLKNSRQGKDNNQRKSPLPAFNDITAGCQENGVPGENNRPVVSHWQTLSHNVVLSTTRDEQGSNPQR